MRLRASIFCRSFGRRCKAHSLLPVPAICFSLSSASPAHSPKEEYVITHSADAPKEEAVHDRSEDQGEPQDDKSELTEKKSVTGWLAAHQLLWSKDAMQRISTMRVSASPSSFLSPFRGGVSVWIVSLPGAGCAGGGEVLGGAAGRPPGAAGEGDAGGQEDGVPPTGK